MKKHLLLLTFFLLAFSAGAQSYWEPVKGPFGGDMSVTKTKDGTLYAQPLPRYNMMERDTAVFRSTDNGHTWEALPLSLDFGPYDSKIVIGPSKKFYFVQWVKPTQSKLLSSSDEGVTWKVVKEAVPPAISIFETQTGTLLRYDSNRISRSTDGGHTWFKVFESTDLNEVQEMLTGDLLLYTKDHNLTFLSKDDGASWTYLNKPLYFDQIRVFFTRKGTWLCYGYPNHVIYRSVNEGATWDTIVPPLKVSYGSMCLLNSGRLLYGGSMGTTTQYSDDDGISWVVPSPDHQYVRSFVLPEALPNGDVLAIRKSALHRSNDGGATWALSTGDIRYGDVWDLKITAEDTLFAITSTGIWRTFNAGAKWTRMIEDVGISETYINFVPDLFATSKHGQLVIAIRDSLLISSDWGTHFFSVPNPGSDDIYNLPTISEKDSTIFVTSHNGLYRSTNGGFTWEQVFDQPTFGFMIHPSGRLLVRNNDHELWYSDNGTTWKKSPLPIIQNTWAVLYCSKTGDILAHYSLLGYVRSSDGGATWSSLQHHILPPYIYTENAEGHFFSWDGLNICLSLDAGFQWQTLPGISSNYISVFSLAISPRQFLYAGASNGLYRTRRPTTEGAYLTGSVQVDADADCTTPDAQPTPPRSWPVKVEGENTWYSNTDSTGRYRMFIDTGTYEVSTRSPHPLWWSICESPQTASLQQLFDADTVEFSAAALLDCPLMQVDVTAPRLRRCFDNPVYVEYCNIGSESADSAWVEIELDPYLSMVSAQLPYYSLDPKRFRFNVGTVQPGACKQFHFTVYVDCDSTVLGQTHCILAHAWPDTLCAPVNGWSGANIEAEAHCLGDTTVQLILRNTGTGISQTLEYIIIEDLVVLDMGDKVYDPGEELVINLPAQGRTWRIESQQEPGHPFSTLAIAFTEGCNGFNSLGFINQFGTNTVRPAWDRFCLENTGSYDPNDKQGFPLGQGPDRRIRPGQDLEYLIRFQNTGTDTAFTVIIRDTLSTWLDAASVRPGAASHPYTWTLSGQGVLTFRFNNILLPDSTTNLEGSQGFVSFRVEQQPEVPLGTQILNEAAIYFDFNAPIITNQTLHTVGLDLKSSTGDLPVAGPSDAVLISPNPVAETAVFHLREGAFQRHRLTLTDALGRTVQQCPLTGSQYIFDRKSLPSGVYGYRVDDAQGRLTGSGKVVVR